LDELNAPKREINLLGRKRVDQKRVFMQVLTNGYTKILRFDHEPPEGNYRFRNNAITESTTKPTAEPLTKFTLYINKISLSLITKNTELFTLHLKGI